MSDQPSEVLLCSSCFHDEGLRLMAEMLGKDEALPCKACGDVDGRKLDAETLNGLAYSFFVQGTVIRTHFGGAPRVQFNDKRETGVQFSEALQRDAKLVSDATGIGFFHYGPRLWMIGEIEPLKDLESRSRRKPVIARILSEYPEENLKAGSKLYRIRLNPKNPSQTDEYDAPPSKFARAARLNVRSQPVLYTSPDLQLCLHECRVSAEDDIYVATLAAAENLRILDLTEILAEDVTEFESLDLAVHMAFLAREHAYPIGQSIAKAAKSAGFDGIRYPSYFSLLRTGGLPFETSYGLSNRRLSGHRDYEKSKIVSNVAVFGRPIADGRMSVNSINRFVLSGVQYGGRFGPAAVN